MRKSYTEHPPCLHDHFDGEKVTFGVYLAPECDFDNEELNAAIDAWHDGEEAELQFRFSVSACLDSMIEMQQCGTNPADVAGASQAAFAALRAELIRSVERIDALRFIPDEAERDETQP